MQVELSMSSSFPYVVACVKISFLFKAEEYPVVGIDHILFTLPSIHGHLGGVHLLAIANNAAMNMGAQDRIMYRIFLCIPNTKYHSWKYRRYLVKVFHGRKGESER